MTAPILATLDALPGPRFRSGGQSRVLCPAHDDHSPSLTYREADNGDALVRCHAGCTAESVVDALGLTMTDLFAPQPTSVQPRVVAVYDYRDEAGAVLYQVVRYDPKAFRQRRPDGSGGWSYRLGDVRRVPYRLPELIASSRGIVVAEGEKDCDALGALGITATCNAGGAGKWSDEWSHYFAGRPVVIIADRDEPGREHARKVAGMLRGTAASVGIVEVPTGKDVSDYLASGATEDDVRRLLRSATDDPSDTTGAVPLAAFLAETLTPAAWLVDGLIPVGPTIGALVGAYKAGKSLAGLQACFAVGSGVDNFLGHAIDHHGAAAFVEYEGTRARLQERARLMATKYGHDARVDIVHRPAHKLDTDAGEAWLLRVCTGKTLCVVGPVAKAASIKREAEPAEWQELAERLQRVADATGCSVVLVHHTRKPSIEYGAPRKVEDFFNGARGSNSYMGAVDFALGVQRDPEKTEGTFYFLERDGESGRLAYDFDTQSLCIWPSERPLSKPTTEDRLEGAFAFIQANPGATRDQISAFLRVSDETARRYLAQLGDRIVVEGEGNQARTYRVAA